MERAHRALRRTWQHFRHRALPVSKRALLPAVASARRAQSAASSPPTDASVPASSNPAAAYTAVPLSEIEMPSAPVPLSFRQKYGQPLASFFLWTSLTFVGLEFAYAAMDTEDRRDEMDAELETLKERVDELKGRLEAKRAGQDIARDSDGGATSVAPQRTWAQYIRSFLRAGLRNE
ncbi:hypothetical protein DFJ74DRAFT_657943 [Hyaloraphidium curvatum]|nr:hypothetical protein DFJ74DRAFT_657943 [Hyaloraphidium curvatum]